MDHIMKTFKKFRANRTLSEDMHEVGEGWRQIGVNFELEDPRPPPTRTIGYTDSGPCYYG